MTSASSNQAFERHHDEVDVTKAARPQDLGAAVKMVVAGGLVALLLGATPLADWMAGVALDWSPDLDPLASATETWREWMDGAGLNRFHDDIHAWFQDWHIGGWEAQ